MFRAALAFALLPCALGACTTRTAGPVGIVEAPPAPPIGWRAIASAADQQRIAELPATWARAVAAVPRRMQAKLRAETKLVEPTAALELPAPPPGPYRCRLIRFGGRAGFATFPPDFCYVDGGDKGVSFTKQTGSNLPGGWLHADTATRQVFLGSLRAAGAEGAPGYGDDPAQDVAGVVERVSPFRWRLVLTRGGRGALLDVYELVPVPPEVPGATPAVPAEK
ncbi:DUF4893 domain-containing protein [Sphingomonas sp.]|jgi:hypothetical protein|uniref:DUF4893 domain-containing protein n=1 Tax=Sphingomonas sp. TaxID=28214 RepID=UPI002ED79F92